MWLSIKIQLEHQNLLGYYGGRRQHGIKEEKFTFMFCDEKY